MSAARRMDPELFVTLRLGEDDVTHCVNKVCGVDRVDLSGDWSLYDVGLLEKRLLNAIWVQINRSLKEDGA